MSSRLQRGLDLRDPTYLDQIADEMECVYKAMIDARRRLMLIERFPHSHRVAALAAEGLKKGVEA